MVPCILNLGRLVFDGRPFAGKLSVAEFAVHFGFECCNHRHCVCSPRYLVTLDYPIVLMELLKRTRLKLTNCKLSTRFSLRMIAAVSKRRARHASFRAKEIQHVLLYFPNLE